MADGDPSDVSDVPLDDSKLRAVVREVLQGARVEGARQVNAETAKAVRAQIVAKRGDGFAMAEGGAGDENTRQHRDRRRDGRPHRCPGGVGDQAHSQSAGAGSRE